jgi:YfiR/HmsC-like
VLTRRSNTSSATLLVLLFLARAVSASDASVPPRLQASLIARVAPFDRSLAARARSKVLLLVAVRRGDAGSRQVAAEVIEALKAEHEIVGLPLSVEAVEAGEVGELVQEIHARHPAILYLATGFSDDAPALAAALDGEDILTMTAESAAVRGGICVGFDLVSGKPRVLVHLQQSKRQHVNFQAALLHLSKVVDQ